MTSIRGQIDTLRNRISNSQDISEADRDLLLRFSNRMELLRSEYSDHRHLKLLRHCTRMAEEVGLLAESLEEREAAEELVRWINRTYDNEYTNHDYRTALRVFGKRVGDSSECPDSLEWIPSGTSKAHNPVPDPADMLDWEADIIPMTEAARNARDAALIAVAFDSGARSSELQDLQIGDVSDDREGTRIKVDGKTGQRSVRLIPSVPYLNSWLRTHPARDDPDAPLWSKLTKPEKPSHSFFLSMLKRAAENAGVAKPVTFRNFRKSNASYLAKEGVAQSYIEDRQGRERGSKATAHYVARFGGDAETEYARKMGVEVEEEKPDPIGPVVCPRCTQETPRHEDQCVWCHQVLDYEAEERIESEAREVRQAALQLARNDPGVIDDIDKARVLSDLFEHNPDLLESAKRFSEALSED